MVLTYNGRWYPEENQDTNSIIKLIRTSSWEQKILRLTSNPLMKNDKVFHETVSGISRGRRRRSRRSGKRKKQSCSSAEQHIAERRLMGNWNGSTNTTQEIKKQFMLGARPCRTTSTTAYYYLSYWMKLTTTGNSTN